MASSQSERSPRALRVPVDVCKLCMSGEHDWGNDSQQSCGNLTLTHEVLTDYSLTSHGKRSIFK